VSKLRGANAVLIVVLPEGFVPRSVWDLPPMFSHAEVYARRIPLYMAQGFAWTFNKHALQERIPGRKWALAVNCKIDAAKLKLAEHAWCDRENLAEFAPVRDGFAFTSAATAAPVPAVADAEGGAV
jgi:hypothetical protein